MMKDDIQPVGCFAAKNYVTETFSTDGAQSNPTPSRTDRREQPNTGQHKQVGIEDYLH